MKKLEAKSLHLPRHAENLILGRLYICFLPLPHLPNVPPPNVLPLPMPDPYIILQISQGALEKLKESWSNLWMSSIAGRYGVTPIS
jgi:hypothetical protein